MAASGHLPDQICVSARMADHLSKHSSHLYKLMRTPNLCDLPLAHDDDLIVIRDGVQPMGNGDYRRFLKFVVDAFLDEVVGLHVHIRSGFV